MKKVLGLFVSLLVAIVSVVHAGAVDCTLENISSDPAIALACDDKEVTHSGMFLSTNATESGHVVVLGFDQTVEGKAQMSQFKGLLEAGAEKPSFQVGETVTMTCTLDSGEFLDCTL